jgi:glycosyltransferase involved in cell wall biosynthesis
MLTTAQTKIVEVKRQGEQAMDLTELPLDGQRAPRISVVIPALNEEENLPYVLPRIPSWVYEIILVDGYSTDYTVPKARELRPEIRIIMQEGRGKGAAIRSGFAAATGDIIVSIDADGSTDPAEIPAFVGTLLAGADFAKGSRFLQGGGSVDLTPLRRLGNWFFVALTNFLFGTQYTDITYGYNATWRRYASSLALEIDGWPNEIISNIRAAQHGLRVVEVASFEYERIAGEAKLITFSAGWAILTAILQERFRKSGKKSHLQPVRKTVKNLSEIVLGEISIQSQAKPATRATK